MEDHPKPDIVVEVVGFVVVPDRAAGVPGNSAGIALAFPAQGLEMPLFPRSAAR
jgi:hypothetical protein